MDVVALFVKANVGSTLERTREKAEADLDDGVWFRFEDQIDLATQGEYGGIRQVYDTHQLPHRVGGQTGRR